MAIPRFEAQVQSISVPTMQNFQQSQNEDIYRAVSNFANTSEKVAEELYKQGKLHEAEVQGAEDLKKAQESGEEFKLGDLPTPYTQAQKVYNQSAINAFAAQYTVDTSLELTNLGHQNRNNPAEFLTKAQSYIAGASADIPEYLKPSIVKPMEMNANSIYASLLKNKMERDRGASKATTLLSVDDMIRDALNTEDVDVQDQKVASALTIIQNAAAIGDFSPELAQKKVQEIRYGAASQRLVHELLATKDNIQKQQKRINLFIEGKTGLQWFDTLSPKERQDAVSDALKSVTDAQRYIPEMADRKAKVGIASQMIQEYEKMIGDTRLTEEDIDELSYGNKDIGDILSDPTTTKSGSTYTSTVASNDLNEGINNGNVDAVDVIDLYKGGYIKGQDAIDSISKLSSPISFNKKKDAYITFKDNLDLELNNIYNSTGGMSQKNLKREYIEKNMDNFLKQDRSDEEITQHSNELRERADKLFKGKSEYQKIHTPQWFKEKTGYDISAIDIAAKNATINGVLNKKKLVQSLLVMTGNDKDMASKLYSMYVAVMEQKD